MLLKTNKQINISLVLPGLSSPWHGLKAVISKVVLVTCFDQGATQGSVLLAAKAGSPKTMSSHPECSSAGHRGHLPLGVKGWCGFSLVQLTSSGPAAAVPGRAGVTPDCCGRAGGETSGAAAALEGVSTARPWGCHLWGSALAQRNLRKNSRKIPYSCPMMPPLER